MSPISIKTKRMSGMHRPMIRKMTARRVTRACTRLTRKNRARLITCQISTPLTPVSTTQMLNGFSRNRTRKTQSSLESCSWHSLCAITQLKSRTRPWRMATSDKRTRACSKMKRPSYISATHSSTNLLRDVDAMWQSCKKVLKGNTRNTYSDA